MTGGRAKKSPRLWKTNIAHFFHCRCYFLFSFHVRTYPPRSGLLHFNTCSPTLNGPRLMRFCHLLPLFYLIRHVQFSRRVSKDGECLRAGPSPLGDVTGGRALRACVALLWPQLLKQKIHLQCFEGRGRAIAEISQWGLSDAPLPQSEWPVWQPPVHIAPENAHTSRKDVLLDVLKVLELWQPTSSIFQDHLRYKNISMWTLSQTLHGLHDVGHVTPWNGKFVIHFGCESFSKQSGSPPQINYVLTK